MRTEYAKSEDGHVAYQVVGSGPLDLVFIPNWASNLDVWWDDPGHRRFLNRLASFSRLICFDKRGTGVSDPVPLAALPTLEQWLDDVRVVMDAAGSERAALFGWGEGGPMAMLFAATYPERTTALVLGDTFARLVRDEDYPHGLPAERAPAFLDAVVRGWGRGPHLDVLNPSVASDPRYREWWSRYQRLSISPGAVTAMYATLLGIDLRPVLPAIRVPTLVVHRGGDAHIRAGHGRYLADHIPGARFVELPGDDHDFSVGDVEAVVDEAEEFLTGDRHPPDADRVLATVLFTDICKSTERAAELGDRRWGQLLAAHHAAVRRELARFRGREVKTAGDGFLATFDGPARAVRCAAAVVEAARTLGVAVRTGVHTGECEVNDDDISGIAVHIAARVLDAAGAGEVLVSSTVKDLVAGSDLRFVDRGARALRGVPGEWHLYAVEP